MMVSHLISFGGSNSSQHCPVIADPLVEAARRAAKHIPDGGGWGVPFSIPDRFAAHTCAKPPSAARRLAIAAPMPREPPVTSATLPASGLSCVLRAMMISSLEFLVLFGTMKV
jgi:hypothetical protein